MRKATNSPIKIWIHKHRHRHFKYNIFLERKSLRIWRKIISTVSSIFYIYFYILHSLIHKISLNLSFFRSRPRRINLPKSWTIRTTKSARNEFQIHEHFDRSYGSYCSFVESHPEPRRTEERRLGEWNEGEKRDAELPRLFPIDSTDRNRKSRGERGEVKSEHLGGRPRATRASTREIETRETLQRVRDTAMEDERLAGMKLTPCITEKADSSGAFLSSRDTASRVTGFQVSRGWNSSRPETRGNGVIFALGVGFAQNFTSSASVAGISSPRNMADVGWTASVKPVYQIYQGRARVVLIRGFSSRNRKKNYQNSELIVNSK